MSLLTRAWDWFDDRTGISRLVLPFFRHPVPPGTTSVRRGWWYVFGVATLAAFVLQVVTGIALATAYVPSTAHAYDSLQFITHTASFGRVLRGLHYFGASAMVILVGAALAHFILAGRTVGAATLSRFFAFHVFFIPALIFGVLGLHLYLVLHNGISEPPEPSRPVDPKTYRSWYRELLERHGRPYWPDAAWREVAFAVAMIATVALLAIVFGPKELGKPPDPAVVDAYPRPDWYFLWYFAVLAIIRPGIENAVIVLAPLLTFLLLFAVPFIAGRGERSPSRRPWAVGAVIAGVLAMGALLVAGEQAPWSPVFNTPPITAQVAAPPDSPIYRGVQLFHYKGCQYCHAVKGEGGNRGPDLTSVAYSLPAAQITARILTGARNMPSYQGNLAPDELSAIVAFLESLNTSRSGQK